MSRPSPENAGLRLSPANDHADVDGAELSLLARSRRSQHLRRHVKMSKLAEVKASSPLQPPRERLADRLARLAKLRRTEEEQARARASRPYEVSDALPLDKMGFIGLMLLPPQAREPQPRGACVPAEQRPALAGLPPSPLTVAAADQPGTRIGLDAPGAGEIAMLLREFHAAPAPVMPGPPSSPPPEPQRQAAIEPLERAPPANETTPELPPTTGTPAIEDHLAAASRQVLADALAGLDPIRRLAGALQAGVPGDGPQPPVAEHPAPPPAALAMPPQPPLPPSEPQPSRVTQPGRHAAAGPAGKARSGWPSFATGFAVALAFGAGLYAYLLG